MENFGGAKLYDDQEKKSKGIDDKEKKFIHKEIERQRRKEMASLYASLRSQLPLEYIKGKRSISDHMYQAVNYIKHLEKNIKELEIKKVRIKEIAHSSSFIPHSCQCSDDNFENCVSVRSCNDQAVEILFNTCLKEEDFKISRVLEVLLEQGLDVITYTCTTINDMLLHLIKAEVIIPYGQGTYTRIKVFLKNKTRRHVIQRPWS